MRGSGLKEGDILPLGARLRDLNELRSGDDTGMENRRGRVVDKRVEGGTVVKR